MDRSSGSHPGPSRRRKSATLFLPIPKSHGLSPSPRYAAALCQAAVKVSSTTSSAASGRRNRARANRSAAGHRRHTAPGRQFRGLQPGALPALSDLGRSRGLSSGFRRPPVHIVAWVSRMVNWGGRARKLRALSDWWEYRCRPDTAAPERPPWQRAFTPTAGCLVRGFRADRSTGVPAESEARPGQGGPAR